MDCVPSGERAVFTQRVPACSPVFAAQSVSVPCLSSDHCDTCDVARVQCMAFLRARPRTARSQLTVMVLRLRLSGSLLAGVKHLLSCFHFLFERR